MFKSVSLIGSISAISLKKAESDPAAEQQAVSNLGSFKKSSLESEYAASLNSATAMNFKNLGA